MLVVPTYLAKSPIHGLGLFSQLPIARGALVWRFHSTIDRVLPRDLVFRGDLPLVAREFVNRYFCFWGEQMLANGDDARFMNHSESPNVKAVEKGLTPDMVAVRDIQPGQELVTDYRDFDDTWRGA